MTPPRILCLLTVSVSLALAVLVGCQDTASLGPETQTAVPQGAQSTRTPLVPSPTPAPSPTPTATPVTYNVYFGDLHVHTSRIHTTAAFHEEFGRGVLRLANLYAKDVMRHDFVAVTNHARLLEDWMWEVTKEVADEFTQDGVFVSFPAFEWTASHQCGMHCSPERPDYPDWGHRNVYFRNTGGATSLLRCSEADYDTPEELFGALPGSDLATTIPHHTAAYRQPFDWSSLNTDYDRLIEIYQRRGDYETDVIDNGWRMGLLLGVVAGSDSHIGVPGWPQGGITAILAPELTRDALFDALLSRHTYATTHGDILLHFFGDEEMQGSVLSARDEVRLTGEIVSSGADISRVELVDNGEVAASWEPEEASSLRFDRTREVGEEQHHFYYVRITLENDHQAWSSPIWVDHAATPPSPAP